MQIGTMQNAVGTKPSRLGTMQDEGRTKPTRLGTMQDEGRTKPSRLGTMQDEARTKPSRLGTMQDEARTKPSRLGTMPDEARTKPSRLGTMPDEARTKPSRLGTMPDEARTKPSRLGTMPDEARTKPSRLGTMPDEARTKPSRLGTMQDEARTKPSRLGTMQDEARTKPMRGGGEVCREGGLHPPRRRSPSEEPHRRSELDIRTDLVVATAMGLRKAVVAGPRPLDEVLDAWTPDDEDAPAVSLGRICLDCGGDGHAHDGCAHLEIARLDGDSRNASEVVLRLRRAVAEHRAAARALRGLVLSEVARGRAQVESPAVETVPPRAAEDALACARCAERDADPAAAPRALPRGARQKAPRSDAQQAFAFAGRRGVE